MSLRGKTSSKTTDKAKKKRDFGSCSTGTAGELKKKQEQGGEVKSENVFFLWLMLKLWYFSEVWSKTLTSQTLLYRYNHRNRRNSLADSKINSNIISRKFLPGVVYLC